MSDDDSHVGDAGRRAVSPSTADIGAEAPKYESDGVGGQSYLSANDYLDISSCLSTPPELGRGQPLHRRDHPEDGEEGCTGTEEVNGEEKAPRVAVSDPLPSPPDAPMPGEGFPGLSLETPEASLAFEVPVHPPWSLGTYVPVTPERTPVPAKPDPHPQETSSSSRRPCTSFT